MDGPDYPQEQRPGTPNNVPSLIHDYRAQRDAWREQARNLARMREEVLADADREAKDIVTTARTDVRRILLKARRDLLVLAAQVRAAGRLGEPDDTPDAVAFLPSDDLGQVGEALTSARHDVRRVLDESRPELEGLASEGEALRAALRQRPNASRPASVPREIPALVHDVPSADSVSPPLDFEFTTIAAGDSPGLNVQVRRSLKTAVVAAATIGGLAVMGIGLWLYRPAETPAASSGEATDAGQTSSSAAKTSSTASNARTTAGRPPVVTKPGFVSVNVAAKRNSWIRVTVDGRVTAERIFKAGETQQVTNAREVSVRAGDAGAVMVSVDGRQASALGREGEVVTRRFAAEAPRALPAESRTPAPTPGVAAPKATSSPAPPVAPPSVPRAAASAPATLPTTTIPVPSATARPTETQVPVPPPPVASASTPSASVLTPRPPAATPERSAAAAPAPVAQVSLQESMTNTLARWLDAHYRQDRATMAAIAPQANVSDSRNEKERMPRGLVGVKRSLEDVKIVPAGPAATLTARVTERMEGAGEMASRVSLISNIWEQQRDGSWQLIDVRIVSPSGISLR